MYSRLCRMSSMAAEGRRQTDRQPVCINDRSDGDFVVKLIDEYRRKWAAGRAWRLQLMIAGRYLRGRYRVAFDRPQALREPAQLFKFELPTTNHVFLPGTVIVQVQSSWFPVYDAIRRPS